MRGAGHTHTFPGPGPACTRGREHVRQEEAPARLLRIDPDQGLRRGKEAPDVSVAERGAGVRQLAQQGPAAEGQALRDEGLGLRLQGADLRDGRLRVMPQSREDVIHGLLQGDRAGWAAEVPAGDLVSSQCLGVGDTRRGGQSSPCPPTTRRVVDQDGGPPAEGCQAERGDTVARESSATKGGSDKNPLWLGGRLELHLQLPACVGGACTPRDRGRGGVPRP